MSLLVRYFGYKSLHKRLPVWIKLFTMNNSGSSSSGGSNSGGSGVNIDDKVAESIKVRDARLLELTRSESSAVLYSLKPMELLFIADFDEIDRLNFIEMKIPFILEQFIVESKLVKENRLKIFTLYKSYGITKTIEYILSNLLKLTENIDNTSSKSLETLIKEYKVGLERYETRKRRNTSRIVQPLIDDRAYLSDIAQYVETFKNGTYKYIDNWNALPDWVKFILKRRTLIDFLDYFISGKWKALDKGHQKKLKPILEILGLLKFDRAAALGLAGQYAKKEPEYFRRFIEPATGFISNLEAQFVTNMEFKEPTKEPHKETVSEVKEDAKSLILKSHRSNAGELTSSYPDYVYDFQEDPENFEAEVSEAIAASRMISNGITSRSSDHSKSHVHNSAVDVLSKVEDTNAILGLVHIENLHKSASIKTLEVGNDNPLVLKPDMYEPENLEFEAARLIAKDSTKKLGWNVRADTIYEELSSKVVPTINNVLPFLAVNESVEIQLEKAIHMLKDARDNTERCLVAVASLIHFDVSYHETIFDTYQRVILNPDYLVSPWRITGSKGLEKDFVIESSPPPAYEAIKSTSFDVNNVTNSGERLLNLELKMMSEIDRRQHESNLLSRSEKAREYDSLKKRAKELKLDLNAYLYKLDLDKLREVVTVVEFANEYYVKEPLYNPDVADDSVAALLPQHALLPGVAESSLLLYLHCKANGFSTSEAQSIADTYFRGDPAPPAPPKLDPFLDIQLKRRVVAIQIGQTLLRKRLEMTNRDADLWNNTATNKLDQNGLSDAQIRYVVTALGQLESEFLKNRSTFTPNATAHFEPTELNIGSVLLPNVVPSLSLPQMDSSTLEHLLPDIDDFNGEDVNAREIVRSKEWNQNTWSDIMSSDKYLDNSREEIDVYNYDVRELPYHLDPVVCREIYATFKSNPNYWTPLRLSCHYRLRLERIEGILTLWYMEDCSISRGEIPAFQPRMRMRFDRGPDDRVYEGVNYVVEDFKEESGFFERNRPEALFLTQEDLERYMWRRSRPFRDFARRPNPDAGKSLLSLPGKHRKYRNDMLIVDLSHGNNHPAPQLTVREKDGNFRWATEAEYRLEVDSKKIRPRRKEDGNWEFEFVRTKHVNAGYHYSLLNTANCPVRAAAEGKFKPFDPQVLANAYEVLGRDSPATGYQDFNKFDKVDEDPDYQIAKATDDIFDMTPYKEKARAIRANSGSKVKDSQPKKL